MEAEEGEPWYRTDYPVDEEEEPRQERATGDEAEHPEVIREASEDVGQDAVPLDQADLEARLLTE